MIKRLMVVTILVLALLLGSTFVAYAGANSQASCIGLDASTNAPVNDQIHTFQQVFHPFGGFVSTIAQLHEGSDSACLTAAGG